jgi:hypothetical protein
MSYPYFYNEYLPSNTFTKDSLKTMKSNNDYYLANKVMYKELQKIKMLVFRQNNLYGSSSANPVIYTYTSISGNDYFGTLMQNLHDLFPECFIYYKRNSNSVDLTTDTDIVKFGSIDSYVISDNTINNVLIISQTSLFNTEINYDSLVTIGTPSNSMYTVINNRKCWVITGTTTFTFNHNFPIEQIINFVSVGPGEGNSYSNDLVFKGGNGGGVVYGTFSILQNLILNISIIPIINPNSYNIFTRIIGPDINITSKDGIINGGSSEGSKIISYTIRNGGSGSYGDGEDGPFISDLGIYVAGGGGGTSSPYISGGPVAFYGNGGAGGGGSISNTSTFGTPNTGGGGLGNGGSNGGSGVVYLYI